MAREQSMDDYIRELVDGWVYEDEEPDRPDIADFLDDVYARGTVNAWVQDVFGEDEDEKPEGGQVANHNGIIEWRSNGSHEVVTGPVALDIVGLMAPGVRYIPLVAFRRNDGVVRFQAVQLTKKGKIA